MIDQIINSGSNFVVIALLARSSSLSTFSQFAIAQSVVLLYSTIFQSTFTEPAIRSPSPHERATRQRAVIDVSVAAIGAAGILAATGFAAGLAPPLVFATIFAAPIIGFVDSLRLQLISEKQLRPVIMFEIFYAAAQLGGVCGIGSGRSAAFVWLLWGLAATPPACYATILLRQLHAKARFITARRTAWKQSFARRYAAEAILINGGSSLAQLIMIPVLGVSFAGSYRAAQIMMGPVTLLLAGIRGPLMIYYRSRLANGTRVIFRPIAAIAGTCATWGTLALLVPRSAAVDVLGTAGLAGRTLLLAVVAEYLARASLQSVYYYVRVQVMDRLMTTARVYQTVGMGAAVVAGYLTTSGNAFVLTLAGSSTVALVIVVRGIQRPKLREPVVVGDH